MTDLARTALEAGELKKAKKYSKKLLDVASKRQADAMYGTAVHHGSLVLGQVALKEGDLETAKDYLLRGGKTPGGGTLDSFGPNMALAKELLNLGERQTVIEYLELCKKFWTHDANRLEAWTKTIREGGIPDFGGNLYY